MNYKNLLAKATAAIQRRKVRVGALSAMLALAATNTYAQSLGGGFQLPMGDVFCNIASALQSQWAPGIILIVIIVEAFLFLVVKKGVLQMLMIVLLAASLALGAGSFLNLIKPNTACAAVS